MANANSTRARKGDTDTTSAEERIALLKDETETLAAALERAEERLAEVNPLTHGDDYDESVQSVANVLAFMAQAFRSGIDIEAHTAGLDVAAA